MGSRSSGFCLFPFSGKLSVSCDGGTAEEKLARVCWRILVKILGSIMRERDRLSPGNSEPANPARPQTQDTATSQTTYYNVVNGLSKEKILRYIAEMWKILYFAVRSTARQSPPLRKLTRSTQLATDRSSPAIPRLAAGWCFIRGIALSACRSVIY